MMFKSAVLAAVVGSASASFPALKTFTPLTSVSDHAAIALDQSAMESLLSGSTAASLEQAKLVYTNGGNSRSSATLSVAGGLPSNVASGAALTGKGIDGRTIVGEAASAAAASDSSIVFTYPTKEAYGDHLDCRVGGLPENERVTDGCLLANGTLTIDGSTVSVPYTYSVETNNNNGRTLQGFSTSADSRMRPGRNMTASYFTDFQKFFDYYGRYDYADAIVMAGFDKSDTSLDNGNIDLLSANSDFDVRAEIVKKGTAYLSVAMYVMYELEDALYDCDSSCTVGSCNDDSSVHALDEAVAFYHGAEDVFLHSLANKRCANFGTCIGGSPTVGDAQVNEKVFKLFAEMQGHLKKGDCSAARPLVKAIAPLIWIPLIQGTLRYAWILDTTNNPGALPTGKAQAEGAIFAAGVLPIINSCSPEAAATIYDNMKIKSTIGCDFLRVKAAFEQCYDKIGVTCGDIGGIVNSGGNGYEETSTRPCQFDSNNKFASVQSSQSSASSSTFSVGSLLGASFLAVVSMLSSAW